MTIHLTIYPDTVNNITFHQVHCIGAMNPAHKHPRPIVAKFEDFKQKGLVQRQSRQLKGMNYGLNE